MPIQSTPEWCPDCDRETDHSVQIRVVTESPDAENHKFAREPYRIATCEHCGSERTRRMNDA